MVNFYIIIYIGDKEKRKEGRKWQIQKQRQNTAKISKNNRKPVPVGKNLLGNSKGVRGFFICPLQMGS